MADSLSKKVLTISGGIAILGGIAIFCFVLSAIGGVATKENQTVEQPASENQQTPIANSSKMPTTISVDPVALEVDKNRLVELKNKFNYDYDEFEKIGWYENKTQVVANTFDKKMLRVRVNNKGYAYLEDQYYGDNWIFHTRVVVKIGDTIYTSDDIPSYDSANHTNNSGGSVWERISYSGGRDNGIIEAIAKSGDASVLVRFAGDQGVSDFTLAARDQQAIKDAYELSNLIKKIGNQ
ncbi:MAG: hypothetical protein M0R20_04470 [Candidatus Omnitrophica bacterium]|jgi:hypothetical protein|nr:hypothetical protein [Candidatus Omnitrophota bacterium]